ncbi:unnamed protein product [Ilex paraguariensis]|uniref:RWP-RK domain-containing protein n=1 Tax=Ilex paraguariensis TaxID=185542 RepID=A0ABC8S9I6_9AQUA
MKQIVFGRMKLQNVQMKGISSGVILMCIQLKGRYVMGRIDIIGHRKTQFCNGRPEIAFGEGLREEIFVQTIKSFPNNEPDLSHDYVQISQNTRSPQGPQAYPNGADMRIGSSEQQPMVDFDVTCIRGNIVITDQSDIPVTDSEKNSRKMISPLLSPEFLPQLYGTKLDDAAKCLGVSRTTLKRFCRKHGILKWPFRKGKKGSNDLPKLNCGNESVRGTEGALYQPSFAPVSMQPRTSARQMPTEHKVSPIVDPMPDVAAMQDMKTFNIKATYRTGIIQFPLSSSSRKTELEDNVSESLKLMRGKFSISYLDTEEGDWILITRDKDLQYCMDVSKQLGKRTIKMLIEDIGSV